MSGTPPLLVRPNLAELSHASALSPFEQCIYDAAGRKPVLLGVFAGLAKLEGGPALLARMMIEEPDREGSYWLGMFDRSGCEIDQFARSVAASLPGPRLDPPERRLVQSAPSYIAVARSFHRSIRSAIDTEKMLDEKGIEPLERMQYLTRPEVLAVLQHWAPNFVERATSTIGVQSKQIDVATYDLKELLHVGYTEMMFCLGQQLKIALAEHRRDAPLLCVGPGPGNDVGYIADLFPERTIVCVEPDPDGFLRLQHNMRERPNVVCVLAKLEDYGALAEAARKVLKPERADALLPLQFAAVFSTFATHHFQIPSDYPKASKGFLLPGGWLMSGDEHTGRDMGVNEALAEHASRGRPWTTRLEQLWGRWQDIQERRVRTTDLAPLGRRLAVAKHGGSVVSEALEIGQVEFVPLEMQAIRSGIDVYNSDPQISAQGCDFKHSLFADLSAWRRHGLEANVFPIWSDGETPRVPLGTEGDRKRLKMLNRAGGIDVMAAQRAWTAPRLKHSRLSQSA